MSVVYKSKNSSAARVTTSKTRPSNTDAYAAGDVVNESTTAGTAFTFANCARILGGSGVVERVLLVDSPNQATKAVLELWLFTAEPAADFDNAVFTPTDAEMLNWIGTVPLVTISVGDATSGAGGNCGYDSGQISLPFIAASTNDNLYGVLVVRNAYTPVSAEKFDITLVITQD